MKKCRGKIKPYKGIKQTEMKKISKRQRKAPYGLRRWQSGAVTLLLAAALSLGGCKTIQYVPVNTDTQVEVKDSTVLHIKDSVRIIERSRWKDYGGLLDTLRIRGNRSEMRAWADTTNNIINGSLEEDPQEEKTRIVYRDRWKVRDSLVFKEVPVPVEVTKEVKVIPKFWRVTGIFGIVCLVLLSAFAGLKVYRFFKFRK